MQPEVRALLLSEGLASICTKLHGQTVPAQVVLSPQDWGEMNLTSDFRTGGAWGARGISAHPALEWQPFDLQALSRTWPGLADPTSISWVTSTRGVGAQWPLALLWPLSSIQESKYETLGGSGDCIRDSLAKGWSADWDVGWRMRRQTGASWGIPLCHHPVLGAKGAWGGFPKLQGLWHLPSGRGRDSTD